MSIKNFMLNWVEHEKSFITPGAAQDYFQHDLAQMTIEADGFVILAEL